MDDSAVFPRIYEKLMIHSDVSKAESWKRLTEEFLNSPLPNTEGIKVCDPSNRNVSNASTKHYPERFAVFGSAERCALQRLIPAALLIGLALKHRLH